MVKRQDIIDDIKRIYCFLGKSPTLSDYEQHGRFSPGTIYNHMGSWNTAKSESLGLALKPYRTSRQLVTEDLELVNKEFSHVPSRNEYKQFGKFTEIVITRIFGSWNAALKETFGKTYEDDHVARQINCEQCGITCFKLPCQLQKNKHHFCSLSCSSKYMQSHKKFGTNKSKMEKYIRNRLEIEHSMLEVKYNNVNIIGLELDIFFPSMMLAFEINGIFHYRPIFGERKFAKVQKNDAEKLKRCKECGIILKVIDTSKQNVFNSNKSDMFYQQIIECFPKTVAL